jgi:hypothetical protein
VRWWTTAFCEVNCTEELRTLDHLGHRSVRVDRPVAAGCHAALAMPRADEVAIEDERLACGPGTNVALERWLERDR